MAYLHGKATINTETSIEVRQTYESNNDHHRFGVQLEDEGEKREANVWQRVLVRARFCQSSAGVRTRGESAPRDGKMRSFRGGHGVGGHAC